MWRFNVPQLKEFLTLSVKDRCQLNCFICIKDFNTQTITSSKSNLISSLFTSVSIMKGKRPVLIYFCYQTDIGVPNTVFTQPFSWRLHITITYITNLVCYTSFHWFFSPECQHIFGKQTGYIFQLYGGGQFSWWGNRSTQRKPLTCRKLLPLWYLQTLLTDKPFCLALNIHVNRYQCDDIIRLFRIMSIPTTFHLCRVLTSEMLGRLLPVNALLL